jgi:hypothetical protein
MNRPDNYILKLNTVKSNLRIQVMHCQRSLQLLNNIKLDADYTAEATIVEKDNIDLLVNLIGNGVQTLEDIEWE